MNRWLASTLCVFALSGFAQAQGLVEKSTDWKWTEGEAPAGVQKIRGLSSPRETAFARAFGEAIGSETGYPSRIVHQYHPGHDPTKRSTARGIRVSAEDGTQLDRFFFDSEEAAFQYALYGAEFGDTDDTIVEARGRQVVVIRGANLQDPERAALLLDAAWGSGLPAPDVDPSVSATRLEGGAMSMMTRSSDPILDAQFQETFEETRARVDDGLDGFERLGEGDHYGFTFPNGTNGFMQNDGGVRTVVVASSPEMRENLETQLRRALPTPEPSWAGFPTGPVEEVDGAADRLERALGD